MTDVAIPEEATPESPLTVSPLLNLMNGFMAELRSAGLPVSLTENLDAMEAIRHIPMSDREALKYALAATLVKHHNHWAVFETVFEVYFSLRGAEYSLADGEAGENGEAGDDDDDAQAPGQGNQEGGGGGDGMSDEDMAEMLYQSLLRGDQPMMRSVARSAVKRFAGMEPGRPVGGTYYLYRTLRNLDLDGVLERLMEKAKEQGMTPFDQRLEKDEYQSRIEKMKKEIEAEIRRRLVADRGVEAMAKTLRKPLPEDVDFMHATREEMTALRKAIMPLTRKLAIRLARKRKHLRRGGLDFRQTIRRSLSYGGVPADPRFKHPNPSKPEIVVIADISGSVAAFARFTLHLVYALSNQFSKVRAFVFIDGMDEVTGFFDKVDDITEAVHRVNTEADVVWVDGHSDYGHAFEVFEQRYFDSITSKTTVMILGDARNNYHSSQAWVIKEIQRIAKQVFWLNPEPGSYWDTGDSILSEYGQHCDGVFEVRNLRQLEKFVEVVL